MYSAFGPDLWPTPARVGRDMLALIDKEAENYLEPEAGKGDLARLCRDRHSGSGGYGRKNKVDVIEINPDLVKVLEADDFTVVGFDFLEHTGVSYHDAIVMNPPFSQGARHLLKAWDFLYHGEIVCLLNAETLRNPHTEERKRLARVIEEYKGRVDLLGNVFQQAERGTDTDVARVYLKKEAADDFDSAELWSTEKPERDISESEFAEDDNMLAIRDELGNLEHYYNLAVENMMKSFYYRDRATHAMRLCKVAASAESNKVFSKLNRNAARAEFIRAFRKDAWQSIFSRMDFHKWLDKKQSTQMQRDIERSGTNFPFTAENIKATLRNIIANRRKLFEMSVWNVFEALTERTFENRQHVEGWKSNDNYVVNFKRVVFPYGCRFDKEWASWKLWYSEAAVDIYNDLDRVLCVLDSRSFDTCYTIGKALDKRFAELERNKKPYGARGSRAGWSQSDQIVSSQYFDIRFYQKGTVHLKWRRKDLWELFNKTAAKGRRWIGSDTQGGTPAPTHGPADPDEFPGFYALLGFSDDDELAATGKIGGGDQEDLFDSESAA